MKIHMGNIVLNLLKKKGILKSQFAKQMNYSKQNINSLLRKENWYAEQILNASKILKYNLFIHYYNINELQNFENTENKDEILEYKNEIKKLQIENEHLKDRLKDKEDIINLLKSRFSDQK